MAIPERSMRPSHRAFDSLDFVARRLRDFRSERQWEQYHTPRNLAIAVSIEAGELLEHFQWRNDEELEELDLGPVGEELADVAIYVVQLADALGLTLSDAIEQKIARNAERYPVELARGNSTKHSELRQRY